MPIGIIETAVVVAAVSGTYSYAKKRKQRARRRNFFKGQRQGALHNLAVGQIVPVTEKDTPIPNANLDESSVHTDALEKIWGIGPIYVERLNGAGIYTYSDLANASAENLLNLVAPSDNSPKPDVEAWIKQASELAKQ